MKLKLDLKNNALNSIYQRLTHFHNATSSDFEVTRSKDMEVDHEDQSVTYFENGRMRFYIDEYYYIPPNYYELKFSVMQFMHGIELLLMDIVKADNEDGIYENRSQSKTINFWLALKKVIRINPTLFTQQQIESLSLCKNLRNQLEHFEIDSNYEELYKISAQLLSILNGIFQLYLNAILTRFYSFNCWKEKFNCRFESYINFALQDVRKNGYDLNYALIKGKSNLSYCIYCEEKSYDDHQNLCLFCLTEMDEELKKVL